MSLHVYERVKDVSVDVQLPVYVYVEGRRLGWKDKIISSHSGLVDSRDHCCEIQLRVQYCVINLTNLIAEHHSGASAHRFKPVQRPRQVNWGF